MFLDKRILKSKTSETLMDALDETVVLLSEMYHSQSFSGNIDTRYHEVYDRVLAIKQVYNDSQGVVNERNHF